MVNSEPFKKDDWWYIVRKIIDSNYVVYAKKDKFVCNGPDIFLYEPGDLQFAFGETWQEAFDGIEKEIKDD